MIVGHRGARNLWPENSLDGFRRTRDLGVDGVEFDVHLARDGELVVIHDPSLERTTEGTGAVADRTAAELAATKLRDGGGRGYPNLDAVLDVYAGTSIELHIEIKTDALGQPYRRAGEAACRCHRAGAGWSSRPSSPASCPRSLETVRRLSPHQRVLGSLDRRSAELMGGLPAALDRFAAIDGCMVAVEKGLLADSLDLCLRRRRRRKPRRLGAQRARRHRRTGWPARSARSPPTGPILPWRCAVSRRDGRRPCGLRPRRARGISCAQRGMACGQRGWKWQPVGGLSGLGTSPVSTISSRRSSGWLGRAAENRALV